MELDPDGRPHPTGRFETLEADAVVLALGQETDSGFLRKIPGIDFQSDGAVVVAPEHDDRPSRDLCRRRHGAERAHRHGRGRPRQEGGARTSTPGCAAVRIGRRRSIRSCRFEMLHLPVYSDAEQSRAADAAGRRRARRASPRCIAGLDAQDDAAYEAQRCLCCGNCFECDQCYAACPEQAIEKLGPGQRYRYLYDRCTGCAVCFESCPCHAIEMIPEPA